MPERFDAVVVGAGIVGAACALELAAARLSVGVVDPGPVGGGATAAGMGHIVVMDGSPVELAMSLYSQSLWAEWVPAAERFGCGTVWVAASAAEAAEARRKQEAYAQHGIACEILDEKGLYELEPSLRQGFAGGLLVPGDSVVYPPTVAAQWIKRANARLMHSRVKALSPGTLTLADGGSISAGVTILAAGMDSVALLPELPLRPKKGHLAITDRYPGFIRHQVVELGYVHSTHVEGDAVAMNVQPRPTGQVLIGSSRQPGCATSEVDHAVLSHMLTRALAYLPGLADLTCIRTWTGVRAATPDGLPLIGPHPARSDLWIATGHEGHGITMAPGTARLLAAQILGRALEIPGDPYLPARFPEVAARV